MHIYHITSEIYNTTGTRLDVADSHNKYFLDEDEALDYYDWLSQEQNIWGYPRPSILDYHHTELALYKLDLDESDYDPDVPLDELAHKTTNPIRLICAVSDPAPTQPETNDVEGKEFEGGGGNPININIIITGSTDPTKVKELIAGLSSLQEVIKALK